MQSNSGGFRWTGLIVLLVILILPWVLLLGWAGLMPGLSDLMGARSPMDLGVVYSEADLESLRAKTDRSRMKSALSPESLGGIRAIADGEPRQGSPEEAGASASRRALPGVRLTEKEISAVLNQRPGLLPLEQVQVRLAGDAIEVSGVMDTARLASFLGEVGVRERQAEWISSWASALADQLPVYIQAAGGVEEGQMSLDIRALRIGRMNLPPEQIQQFTHGVIHSDLGRSERYRVDSLSLAPGFIRFQGDIPPEWLKPEP